MQAGRRHVDKLVQVHRFDGREDWIAIHVEVQSQHDDGFAKRMFVYNYRIFDRYDRPVASLAVLADDNPNWRPSGFGFELFGCSHRLDWSKARVLEFFAILDWMMQLPEELELELLQDIESIEGERSVKYVTSVERLAIARGERIGIEKGLAKGIEKGIDRGVREGGANLLKRLLTSRFGALPSVVCARLADASTEQIEQWGERVLIADSIEDVFREN